MVPFDVTMGKQRASITINSLFWFFVVTAGATIIGELIYQKWIAPNLNVLPNVPASWLPGSSNVVSTQTPSNVTTLPAPSTVGRYSR